MARQNLGQIHIANREIQVGTSGDSEYIDLCAELTKQLQTLVRAGTYHKVTGIDIGIDTQGLVGGGQVTGKIYYFAPTRGRCEAFRGAFAAMRNVFKMQGISMRDNEMYDFKAPLDENGDNAFANQATLDGTNGLCLSNDTDQAASIFHVHNASVKPTYEGTTGDLYQTGFDTILTEAYEAATGLIKPDFVLNDEIAYTGNEMTASTQKEFIPFVLSWTPDSTDIAVEFQWRPDPALYLAVLCGQLRLEVEEVNLDEGAPALNLQIAVHVAGWKSIMADPETKKKKRSKRLTHGRKHRK